MRDLVRAGLPRDVEVRLGWLRRKYRFLLPPPTVQDALELITSRAGYVSGDANDKGVFREALIRWVSRCNAPRRHVRKLVSEIDSLADYAITLVFEGPKIKRRKRHKDDKAPDTLWEEVVAGYAAAFPSDPWAVYTRTSWPFFLHFMQEAARVEAKQQLAAAMAQHPTDAMLHSLQDVIGAGRPQLTDMERSQRAIADLEAMWGDVPKKGNHG